MEITGGATRLVVFIRMIVRSQLMSLLVSVIIVFLLITIVFVSFVMSHVAALSRCRVSRVHVCMRAGLCVRARVSVHECLPTPLIAMLVHHTIVIGFPTRTKTSTNRNHHPRALATAVQLDICCFQLSHCPQTVE